MKINSSILLSWAFVFLPMFAFAQTAIDVNFNMKHSIGDFSEFDRNKYIILHASLRENEWDSPTQQDTFLNNYDVYLGRTNGTYPWEFNQTEPDPNQPGFPDINALTQRGQGVKNNYANATHVHALEDRNDMMIGGQMVMYPNGQLTNPNPCCSNASPWAYANYQALGKFMANMLTTHFGEGGSTGEPRPNYIEVMNEPPLWNLTPYNTTNENIFTMHRVVADSIHAHHPDILVGGFTAAAPNFEADNFDNWNEEWKSFIDITEETMDFYSVHIYDRHPSGNTMNDLNRRSGSNTEAVLDIMEHYGYLKLGAPKPFIISEYGYWSPGLDGTPYTKERDWGNIRSFSAQMMQFMERPDKMLKCVPFMILKANWWSHPSGNKYPYRLLRQNNELPGSTGSQWVYTELLKFFELWKEVRGTRIETFPSDIDIQTDAYVDGNVAYLIINNLNLSSEMIQLHHHESTGNTLENIEVKHLYEVNGLPTMEVTQHNDFISEITIGREATMIIKYTFTDDVVIDETYEEEKIYANKYLQNIQANQAMTFELNGATPGNQGEAVLRLGLGRDHGRSLHPTIQFNGTTIEVPTDWRGYNQLNRDRFFGMIEIPISYDLLQANNTVSITFGDSGGHVSSLSLQNFVASQPLIRSEVITSLENLPKETALTFTIMPNPSDGNFKISTPQAMKNAAVQIKTLDGKTLQRFQMNGTESSFELGKIQSGIYLVTIQENGKIYTQKLVID
ncbi:MAG: T9SS type A sorting domain-containing protein [Bacteroidota bacterium]